MPTHHDPDARPGLRVAPLAPETQGFLFTLDDEGEPLPGLEDFFPDVPVAEVPDLDFERSRRRFTQGA